MRSNVLLEQRFILIDWWVENCFSRYAIGSCFNICDRHTAYEITEQIQFLFLLFRDISYYTCFHNNFCLHNSYIYVKHNHIFTYGPHDFILLPTELNARCSPTKKKTMYAIWHSFSLLLFDIYCNIMLNPRSLLFLPLIVIYSIIYPMAYTASFRRVLYNFIYIL